MTSTTLNYNIRWTEQTFRSRPVAEALLGPEHELGNITTNDYELAIRFLPGFHRHYRVLGGLTAIPIVYALRRPGWSTVRTYTVLAAGTMAGFAAGHAVSLIKHLNFVRSLENPIGISRAFENVQQRIGGTMPPGPVIIRQCRSDHQSDFDAQDHMEPVSSSRTSKPTSKWEQIRVTSARPTAMSSWEALRQKHEKTQLSKSGIPVVRNQEDHVESHPSDREGAQAEFDAMLERERKMGDGN
ncbi:hypothetical protein JOM56_006144 [Amanita muscaria]